MPIMLVRPPISRSQPRFQEGTRAPRFFIPFPTTRPLARGRGRVCVRAVRHHDGPGTGPRLFRQSSSKRGVAGVAQTRKRQSK